MGEREKCEKKKASVETLHDIICIHTFSSSSSCVVIRLLWGRNRRSSLAITVFFTFGCHLGENLGIN